LAQTGFQSIQSGFPAFPGVPKVIPAGWLLIYGLKTLFLPQIYPSKYWRHFFWGAGGA